MKEIIKQDYDVYNYLSKGNELHGTAYGKIPNPVYVNRNKTSDNNYPVITLVCEGDNTTVVITDNQNVNFDYKECWVINTTVHVTNMQVEEHTTIHDYSIIVTIFLAVLIGLYYLGIFIVLLGYGDIHKYFSNLLSNLIIWYKKK
jgi:hypothetical protein